MRQNRKRSPRDETKEEANFHRRVQGELEQLDARIRAHVDGLVATGESGISPDAAARMREAVPMIHPALPRFDFAFAHDDTHGLPSRRHGGSVPAFTSTLVLFDALGVGVFVCQNSFGEALTDGLVDAIAERFLPPASPSPVVPAGDGRPPHAASLVGDHRRATKADTPAFTRGPAVLLEPPLVVETDDEGFVVVDGERFVHTGELVFQRARAGRAPEVVVFVPDADGVIRWVHRGLASAERPPWHGTRGLQLGLYGLALAILALAALGKGVWSRRTTVPREHLGLIVLAARRSLLGMVVPYLYVAWVDAGQVAYLRPLRFGEPAWLGPVRALVPIGASIAAVALVRAIAGRRRPRARARPALAVTVALATCTLPLLQGYWRTPPPGLRASS